jgi:hypothetical protein
VRDCLLAYQYILQAFTKVNLRMDSCVGKLRVTHLICCWFKSFFQALVSRVGFPPALHEVVEELWWCYLEEWTATAKFPILQCFLQAKREVRRHLSQNRQ